MTRWRDRICAWVGSALLPMGLLCSTGFAAAATQVLTPVWERELGTPGEACSDYQPPGIADDVHTDGFGHVYAFARDRLISLDADGALRWSLPTCPGCEGEAHGRLAPVVVTAAGQVWAIETRTTGTYSFRNVALHRIAPDGTIAASVSLVGTAFEQSWPRLLADDAGAILLRSDASGLLWFGVDMAGASTTVRTLALVLPERSLVPLGLRRRADGDLLIAVRGEHRDLCFPGLPYCRQPDVMTVLRTGFDGTLRWRHDTSTWTANGAFDDDDRFRFLDTGARLRTVSADGAVVVADTSTAGVTDVYAIAGPEADRLLIPSYDGLVLLDTAGQQRDQLGMAEPDSMYPWQVEGIRTVPDGFLVPLYGDPDCDSAVIYGAGQLHERYRLRSPEHACPAAPPPGWQETRVSAVASRDGALTVLHPRCHEPVPRVTLARYALPGTPAGGLLFRDGFDP